MTTTSQHRPARAGEGEVSLALAAMAATLAVAVIIPQVAGVAAFAAAIYRWIIAERPSAPVCSVTAGMVTAVALYLALAAIAALTGFA